MQRFQNFKFENGKNKEIQEAGYFQYEIDMFLIHYLSREI